MKPGIFNQISDPRHFVAVRNLRGGPSKESMLESLQKYREKGESYIEKIAAEKTRMELAVNQREQSAKNLMIS